MSGYRGIYETVFRSTFEADLAGNHLVQITTERDEEAGGHHLRMSAQVLLGNSGDALLDEHRRAI